MNLFDNPHKKMKTIAITGTKGKTTTSFMIKNIIEKSGKKCGVIGTTGIYIGDKYYPNKNTTPLSYDTLKYMNEMVEDKIDYGAGIVLKKQVGDKVVKGDVLMELYTNKDVSNEMLVNDSFEIVNNIVKKQDLIYKVLS